MAASQLSLGASTMQGLGGPPRVKQHCLSSPRHQNDGRKSTEVEEGRARKKLVTRESQGGQKQRKLSSVEGAVETGGRRTLISTPVIEPSLSSAYLSTSSLKGVNNNPKPVERISSKQKATTVMTDRDSETGKRRLDSEWYIEEERIHLKSMRIGPLTKSPSVRVTWNRQCMRN